MEQLGDYRSGNSLGQSMDQVYVNDNIVRSRYIFNYGVWYFQWRRLSCNCLLTKLFRSQINCMCIYYLILTG